MDVCGAIMGNRTKLFQRCGVDASEGENARVQVGNDGDWLRQQMVNGFTDATSMQVSSLFTATIVGLSLVLASPATAQRVNSVEALVTAVAEGKSGAIIELAEGTFRLAQPLDLKSGVTLKGAGIGKTIITNAETWTASPDTLPDPETNHQKFDRSGYLLRLADKAEGITVSHLTLTGPKMHGAPTIFRVIFYFTHKGIATFCNDFCLNYCILSLNKGN